MPEDNVLDQFSEEFPSQEGDNNKEFGDASTSLDAPEKGREEEGNDDEEKAPKNRHIRRLEAKLNKEREANIHMAARLQAQSEIDRFRNETRGQSIDERLLTLYGNDDNGRKAAEITQSLLEDTAKRAREDALHEFRSIQEKEAEQVDVETDYINDQLESLEEDSGMDLTGNSPSARKNRSEFLDFLERLSPKDEDGDVKEYADFSSTFSLWTNRRTTNSPANRQKELASRGMTSSGSGAEKQRDLAGETFLKNAGII